MKTIFALGLLAAIALAAPAFAEPVAIPLSATGAANDIYIDDAGPGVWEETNGLPGLQKEATTLADGTVVPADTQLA